MITRAEYEELIKRTVFPENYVQVRIGNILSKMRYDLKILWNDEIWIDILAKWEKCGLHKSLQEIAEESRYYERDDFYECGMESAATLRGYDEAVGTLKDQNAENLFSFLLELFPKK